MRNKRSVLIPAYNEVKIGCLIMDKTIAIKLINNIEIESHQETRTKSFNQEINTGKGPAIRRAVELVTGDFLIVQDAYFEYEPEEFNYLLRPRINVFLMLFMDLDLSEETHIAYFSFGIVSGIRF